MTYRSWVEDAACRGVDPDDMFVGGAEQHVAKRVCQGCTVVAECAAYALSLPYDQQYGVWGGMTARERRALIRRREPAPAAGRQR